MLKYQKLPLIYNADLLYEEICRLPGKAWHPHFNRAYYTGDWSVIPLRSVGGVSDHIYPDPTGAKPFSDTQNLRECPYTRQVIDSLSCEKTAVRFMRLGAESHIKEHKDYNLSVDDEDLRLHLPVTTHSRMEFCLEDEKLDMQPGECWYINFNLRHRLYNPGPGARIHLVVDCVVNDWLRERLR